MLQFLVYEKFTLHKAPPLTGLVSSAYSIYIAQYHVSLSMGAKLQIYNLQFSHSIKPTAGTSLSPLVFCRACVSTGVLSVSTGSAGVCVCARARHICLCRDQNTILRAHGGQSKNCFFKHTHFYSVQREKKEGIWLKGNCQYSGTDLYRCVQVSEGIDDVGVTSVGFLCTNRLTIPFNHTLPVAHTHTHTICSEDMYAQDSIDMLTQAGIQFKRHEEEGIEMSNFAELLTSSGLVLREEISWITFARSPQTSLSQHFMHTSLQVFYGKCQGAGAKLKLRGREFI